MQTRKDDPAFPIFDEDGSFFVKNAGLTKREYFASQALQGLLASPKPLPDNAENAAVCRAEKLIEELNRRASKCDVVEDRDDE